MLLGTKARYAVMAMVELSSRGEGPVTLAQLAESQEIPLPYLEQIFAKLRRAELVRSVRGPGGGYALSRPARETNIADIIDAVEESVKMTRCEGHSAAPGGCMTAGTRCATHDLWEGLGEHIVSYLSGITLDDVQNRRVPGVRACGAAVFPLHDMDREA